MRKSVKEQNEKRMIFIFPAFSVPGWAVICYFFAMSDKYEKKKINKLNNNKQII